MESSAFHTCKKTNVCTNDIINQQTTNPSMKTSITLAVLLAGILTVVALPSYADHVQITISLTPYTEAECDTSYTCVSLSAATLDVGGEVIWANDGSETITLTSGKAGGHHTGEDFGPIKLEPGQTYSLMFEEAGKIDFHLVDHPWMVGTIDVVSDEEHTHDDDHTDGHKHAALEAEKPIGVAIDVSIEDEGGVNLNIMTQGLVWAPENVNEDHIPGEGHAHLYVDGVKTRIYTPYFHIPGLEAGVHHIRVTLNANTHDDMYVNGFPVEAVATVVVSEHEHDHDQELSPVNGDSSISIDATVHTDLKSGYNLEVSITDFVISGEGVDAEHVSGEGYAVISIDGEYFNRLYGEWIKIPALDTGVHTITVNLFSYDHRPYHWNGEPIETSIVVEASADDGESMHMH